MFPIPVFKAAVYKLDIKFCWSQSEALSWNMAYGYTGFYKPTLNTYEHFYKEMLWKLKVNISLVIACEDNKKLSVFSFSDCSLL